MMEYTEQEIFDKVCDHLATQGYRSTKSYNGACLYRDVLGGSCAVGCLIPDEDYDSGMERKGVGELFSSQKWRSKLPYLAAHVPLLNRLQTTHDGVNNWCNPENMIFWLRDIATAFNLNTNVLDVLDFSKIRC